MLENLETARKIWPCKIRSVLETLSESDQKIMVDAIANPDWSTLGLARALTERGLPVTEPSLKRHRDNLCSCRFVK